MTAKVPGIVAFIIAIVAIINFVFSACGLPAIPVDESQITAVVSGLIALGGVVATAWFNFNSTNPAKVGQQITDGLKSGEIDLGKVQKLIIAAAKAAEKLAAAQAADEEAKEVSDITKAA